jgi:RimJ/RimL family protein N-acetyltransferase
MSTQPCIGEHESPTPRAIPDPRRQPDTVASMGEFYLATERLVLRQWRDKDREPFAQMNADPVVMEFFTAPLSRRESDAAVDRYKLEFDECGFCPWAVEERSGGAFIGFVGLHAVPTTLAFSPAVEVGWRLAEPFWGHGYATEAGRASLRFGFETLGLDEIVSMTAIRNVRSARVMRRLGMRSDPGFDHPGIPDGHAVRPHLLYRLAAVDWRARADAARSAHH